MSAVLSSYRYNEWVSFVLAPPSVSDIEFLDLIIQRSGRDAQLSGGIFLNPQALFKSVQNRLFFFVGQ